jgi:hypothetical protein
MQQKPITCLTAVAALGILFTARLPSLTASFDSRHVADVAGNPSDLHFRLDTADGQRAFHIGERIPLTLAFSSDTPAKYKLNAASYDRSGRLPTEQFVMEREAIDPYLDYFGAGVLGWLAGGIRGYPVLDREPVNIKVELNQWFRFDRPGHYRFYLKSHRLARESAPGESQRRTVEFAAVSNIVEIEILAADAAWETMKLTAIKAILDPPGAEQTKHREEPLIPDPPDEHVLLAWRELEYLGTPEAVQTAFDIARKTGSSPHTLLLFAAPDRRKAIAAFDAYLSDPQMAIREWDIRVRAAFTWMEKDKPQPLPVFFWQYPDEAGIETIQKLAAGRQARFDEILRAEAVRLIPIAASKDSTGRKISGEAIAALAPEEARAASLVPPDDYGLTREQLIATFPDLPADRQAELLGNKWDLVRGPEMIPALRHVIAKEKPRATRRQTMSLNVWGTETGIAIAALERLAQVSSQEIVRVIKDDIASGEPRFAGYAVRELPAQALPEIDSALIAQLNKDYIATMPLVAKFGSARLLDEVRKGAIDHPWPCAMEQPVVSYFVRIVPEENGEGRAMLHQAMGNRKNCGFFHFLLGNVAAVAWNPAIQAEAISSLDDPDPEVATSAAQALASHGGPEVEASLWKRLEKWSQQWSGRAAELEGHPITGIGPNEERRLGTALFNSIATAQAWLLNERRRRRLAALCVDDWCREQWGSARASGAIRIEVANGGRIYPTAFHVDDYSSVTLEGLKQKLQQFPAGTLFCWSPQTADPADGFSRGQRQEMFQDLRAFLSEHSMSIERCSK